jgi:hypothetical protein
MPRLNWHGMPVLRHFRRCCEASPKGSCKSRIYPRIYPQIDDALPIEVILWSHKRGNRNLNSIYRRHLSWLAIWVFGRS